MAKERLSKLQKWILVEAYKKTVLPRRFIRLFFNKWFHPGINNFNLDDTPSIEAMGFTKKDKEKAFDRNFYDWPKGNGIAGEKLERFSHKEEYRSTKAIEVTISRTLKNMIAKGILLEHLDMERFYHLTEKGCLMLTEITKGNAVNFKEYMKKVEDDFYGKSDVFTLGDMKKMHETTQKIMKKRNNFQG